MIEAVAAAGATPQPTQQPLEAQVETMSSATPGQVGEFARAAAVPQDVQAAPPVSESGLAERLSHQADAIMTHLRAAGPSSRAPVDGPDSGTDTGGVPNGPGIGLDRAKANEAVDQMERAYMFAIETTLASRGSTETTKIFNTLLKGQ